MYGYSLSQVHTKKNVYHWELGLSNTLRVLSTQNFDTAHITFVIDKNKIFSWEFRRNILTSSFEHWCVNIYGDQNLCIRSVGTIRDQQGKWPLPGSPGFFYLLLLRGSDVIATHMPPLNHSDHDNPHFLLSLSALSPVWVFVYQGPDSTALPPPLCDLDSSPVPVRAISIRCPDAVPPAWAPLSLLEKHSSSSSQTCSLSLLYSLSYTILSFLDIAQATQKLWPLSGACSLAAMDWRTILSHIRH